jgi:hypothetical protein
MDVQTRDELLYLCRDYADYINRPDAFTPEQTRAAIQEILHRVIQLLNHTAAAARGPASAE